MRNKTPALTSPRTTPVLIVPMNSSCSDDRPSRRAHRSKSDHGYELMTIRNQWSNHTGLAAMNLLLANVWTMYRWDIREKGQPSRGWWRGTKYLVRAALVGWWGPRCLHACRLQRS